MLASTVIKAKSGRVNKLLIIICPQNTRIISPQCYNGQCATGNPVPVPVDPVDFFKSGSGPVPAKYRPDRPDLTSKFGCRI